MSVHRFVVAVDWYKYKVHLYDRYDSANREDGTPGWFAEICKFCKCTYVYNCIHTPSRYNLVHKFFKYFPYTVVPSLN
jgi:hypothetical protein